MISPETIALVRDRTDIVAVISESVPSLKRRGRTFVGICPFHKEKTPSFHVNPDRGFFHCFGCKEAGSAIDFVMKQEGATFPEAVRSLAERVGIVVEEDKEKVDRGEVDRQKKQKDDLYSASNVAATFYEQQLRDHPLRRFALEELARRGLVPSWAGGSADKGSQALIDDTLQAFRIGYAPPGWDALANYFRAQGVSPMAGESVGLLVPRSSGSGHTDRFFHRLMFAVTDVQGRVVAFSGRALAELPAEHAHLGRPQKEPGQSPAKYINSPQSPIYSKGHMLFGLYQARHAVRQEEVAVLVEGNFDVVSLHARGLANVVAPLGTAFTADQAKLLKRFAPSVVFLFDADAAGQKAVRASREPAREAGLTAKVATLPEGEDPDTFARVKGVEAVRGVIARGKGMLEFLFDAELDATFASADAHERAARVQVVAKLLADDDDPLVRSMHKAYVDQLASRLDIVRSPEAFRALERAVKHALANAPPPKMKPLPPRSTGDEFAGDREKAAAAMVMYGSDEADDAEHPERVRVKARPPGSRERAEIVGAVIEFPALLEDAEVQAELANLEGPSARTVMAIGATSKADVAGGKTIDIDAFLAQIPPAIQSFARERIAAPHHETIEEARRHLLENGARLQGHLLSQQVDGFAREQHRAAGDWDAELELGREASERAQAMHAARTKKT